MFLHHLKHRLTVVALFFSALLAVSCKRDPPKSIEIVPLGARIIETSVEPLFISVDLKIRTAAFFRVRNLEPKPVKLEKIKFTITLISADWRIIGRPKEPVMIEEGKPITLGMLLNLNAKRPKYAPSVKWMQNPQAAPAAFTPRFTFVGYGSVDGVEVRSAFTHNQPYPRLKTDPHVDAWLE